LAQAVEKPSTLVAAAVALLVADVVTTASVPIVI
jgi:hypothetical protein